MDRPPFFQSLLANARQIVLVLVDLLPDWLVATEMYRRVRRRLSKTPLRFEPPEPPVDPPPRDRWFGRRLADPATDLVVEGFPGSANSYVSNCLRKALRRPAVIESHFHYTAQLRRALALGVPTLVVVREPAQACVSLRNKEPELWTMICLWRWILYHRYVLKKRSRLEIVLFDDVVQDIDVLRRRYPAVAALVGEEIEAKSEFRRSSSRREPLAAESFASRLLLRRARSLFERLS